VSAWNRELKRTSIYILGVLPYSGRVHFLSSIHHTLIFFRGSGRRVIPILFDRRFLPVVFDLNVAACTIPRSSYAVKKRIVRENAFCFASCVIMFDFGYTLPGYVLFAFLGNDGSWV